MIIKPLLKPTSAVTSEASKVKVTLPITITYLFLKHMKIKLDDSQKIALMWRLREFTQDIALSN